MARWDYRYVGDDRFPATLSTLEPFLTLERSELAEVRGRGPMNRPAVSPQVGLIKMTGTELNSVQLIPAAVLDHVGRQLGSGEGTPLIASIRTRIGGQAWGERVVSQFENPKNKTAACPVQNR